MTTTQFDNGYWYAADLKKFATSLGIPAAGRLRKDELEKAIQLFLRTGRIDRRASRGPAAAAVRDVERGLRLDLRVFAYTNDTETWDFLEREARKLAPKFKRKSGARYRLNRWREEQITAGVALSYRGLVKRYAALCRTEGAFARIPHGRYINFVSDFLAGEKGATTVRAAKAWRELKVLDVPKDYESWRKWHSSKRKGRR